MECSTSSGMLSSQNPGTLGSRYEFCAKARPNGMSFITALGISSTTLYVLPPSVDRLFLNHLVLLLWLSPCSSQGFASCRRQSQFFAAPCTSHSIGVARRPCFGQLSAAITSCSCCAQHSVLAVQQLLSHPAFGPRGASQPIAAASAPAAVSSSRAEQHGEL